MRTGKVCIYTCPPPPPAPTPSLPQGSENLALMGHSAHLCKAFLCMAISIPSFSTIAPLCLSGLLFDTFCCCHWSQRFPSSYLNSIVVKRWWNTKLFWIHQGRRDKVTEEEVKHKTLFEHEYFYFCIFNIYIYSYVQDLNNAFFFTWIIIYDTTFLNILHKMMQTGH